MDEHQLTTPRHFATLAILFELSLGLLALVLGWLTGPLPWQTLVQLEPVSWLRNILVGTLAAAVLFAGLVVADRKPVWILRDLQRTVQRHVAPLFRDIGVGGLLLISLAAGLGEELLFRGYFQAGLTVWLVAPGSKWFALAIASVVFGVCHWVSAAYAIVATAMGLLLGTLLLVTDSLLAPVIAHGLYDFLALLYLTRPALGRPVPTIDPDEA
jgi:membrane protease YdiL (CAAX protease family)